MIDIGTYLGNGKEYTQLHVQYPYIAMSPDLYIPVTEPFIDLNIHVHQLSIIKWIQYIHCKAKQSINLKPDPKILDAGDLILPLNLPKHWSLVCVLENRPFPMDYSTYRIISRTEL